MRTVGSVLKNARLGKKLDLKQVEAATKIKSRILARIETDELGAFKSFGHVQGLIKNYAEFLGLDTDYLIAIFRRQVNLPATRASSKIKFPRLSVSFRTQFVVLAILVSVFVYLAFQLVNLRAGPRLEVRQPAPGAVVHLPKIEVAGVADSESQITINGQKVPTNLAGEFSAEFDLTPGVNTIEIIAKKGAGVERKVVRTVEFID